MGIGAGTELVTQGMQHFGSSILDCQAVYGMISWFIALGIGIIGPGSGM